MAEVSDKATAEIVLDPPGRAAVRTPLSDLHKRSGVVRGGENFFLLVENFAVHHRTI